MEAITLSTMIDMADKAIQKHGKGLTMPAKCKTWSDCFTIVNGKIVFWFNTPDGSTHAEVIPCIQN